MRRTSWVIAALVAGLAVPAATARADGVADEAELQFQIGIDHYRTGDYTGALEHFFTSNRLVPNRNVVYNIARVYERLDRPADAYRYYLDALEGERDTEVIARIRAALDALAPRVAVVDVITDPPLASVFVDRHDLGTVGRSPRTLALPPGQHTILAELAGHETATSESFAIAAGQRREIRLALVRIVGTLEITGEEGIEVRLGSGEAALECTVPCALELPPGMHVVNFARPGFEPSPRQVTVTARETTTVVADLRPLVGSLLITADATTATVELDGHVVGFTPVVVPSVTVGPHEVRISLSGYEPIEREIEIVEGQQAELRDLHLVARREVTAASRRAERIADAPASISIISRQEIEAFNYPTIMEALRGTRGFALTHDSIYSNASVRGLGQPNDYNNRLLVLSDGAILNEDILQQAFIGYDGRVDLEEVERIEIVRGAGSVLYGTGAVAGVVNLVPRDRDEPTSVRFGVSLVENDVARGNAAFALRLGEDSGVRASVSGAHSGGRDAELTFDADGDGVDDRNVAHGIDAFDAFTITGRAWHEALTVQWYYNFREISIPTGSFGSIFDEPANQYVDQRGLLEIRFEPRITSDLLLSSRVYLNYTYFHLENLYETEDVVPGTGEPFEQEYTETYHGLWAGAEARLVWEPIPQLRLTLGGEGAHHGLVRMDIRQREVDDSRTRLLDIDKPFTVLAGYLLGDWEPVREVRISAGVRADGWLLSRPAQDFVSFNPRLAVILRMTPSDTLKVMGGRAFRAPTTYEFYFTDGSTQAPSDCCGTVLEPETFYSAEIEYTHQFDDEWSVLVAAHGLLGQRFIDTVAVPEAYWPEPGVDPELSFYRNRDEDQLLVGADAEVRRELRNGWMLAASYGYLWAQYVTNDNSDEAIQSNPRVPNAPEHYASVRTIVPVIDRYLRVALRVSLEAPRRIDAASDRRTDPAVVADLVVSGSANEYGLRYAVGVYNLFDWRYALPVAPFASSVMPQRGRGFMASLTWQF